MKNRLRRLASRIEAPDWILILCLVSYLIYTVSSLTDYGEAWDNVTMYQYGKQTAQIYLHPFQKYFEHEYGPVDIRFFGPFLVTVAFLFSKIFSPLFPFWSPLEFFRFIYFLTYLAGVVALYSLCKRYFSGWVGIGAVLLFIFQPLFFGQAPVSPKDTTFMALVIISLYFGLKMIDQVRENANQSPLLSLHQVRSLAGLVVFLILFAVFHQQLIETFLSWVINSGDENLFRQLLEKYATEYSADRIGGYVARVSMLARGLVMVSLCVVAILIITPRSLAEGIRRTWSAFGGKFVIPAGILLGLSISVRILGLLIIGILVSILIVKKSFRIRFFQIAAYSLTSILTVYVTWPYLWPRPIDRFVSALSINLGHQHGPPVLFNGQSYAASSLPVSYVPTLIGIQLTIMLLLLAAAGLVILLVIKKQRPTELMIVIGLWFFMPVLLFMGLRPALHDNIRHVLFILPPLFLLAGLSLEFLLQWLKGNKYLYLGLILVMVLPGILHIVEVHPYEYIYFNQFAGGTTQGAALYEKDYLALSLSEAIEYVNEVAPENSVVYVLGPENIARNIIRDDIAVISRNNNPADSLDRPDTYLVTFEKLNDEAFTTLYQVMAGDVPLGGVYISSFPD